MVYRMPTPASAGPRSILKETSSHENSTGPSNMPAARSKVNFDFEVLELPGASSYRMENSASFVDDSVPSCSKDSTPWHHTNGHQETSGQSNGPSTSTAARHRSNSIRYASAVARHRSNLITYASTDARHRSNSINMMVPNVLRSPFHSFPRQATYSRGEAALNSSSKRRLEGNEYFMPAENQTTHHARKKKNKQELTKKKFSSPHFGILRNRNGNHNPSPSVKPKVEPNESQDIIELSELDESIESSQLQQTIEPTVAPSQLQDVIELSQSHETAESSQLQQTVEPRPLRETVGSSQLQETVEPRPPLQVEVSIKIEILYTIENGIHFADEFPGEKISLKEFKDFIAHKGDYAYYFKMTHEEHGFIFKRIMDDQRLLPINNGEVYCKIYTL